MSTRHFAPSRALPPRLLLGLSLALALAAVMPASAGAEPFPGDRITAAAVGDWDRDGKQDLVIIARPPEGSEDDNGLYIYLADDGESRLSLKVSAPNTVWGPLVMYGQEAGVSALPNGSIDLMTQNSSIGRSRWEQHLTIAYRKSQFIVAGYTYSYRDTLDPNTTGECDLNVITGKGSANGKPVSIPGAEVTFLDWNDDTGLKACGFYSP